MEIHIIFFSGMILEANLVLFEEQVFDVTHHDPCRNEFRVAYRTVIPFEFITNDNIQDEVPFIRNKKKAVVPKTFIRL